MRHPLSTAALTPAFSFFMLHSEARYPGQDCEVLDECPPPADGVAVVPAEDAAAPTTATTTTVANPDEEFIMVEAGSIMAGEDLPWDLGDTPQWVFDSAVSPANGDGAGSLVNIPADGPLTHNDLVLKVAIPVWGWIKCMAKIDVHMPFDYFTVLVNGEVRVQHHEKAPDGVAWAPVGTGFNPGNQTIVFRVQNSDYPLESLGVDRQGNEDRYGTGLVWLSQCRIKSLERRGGAVQAHEGTGPNQ